MDEELHLPKDILLKSRLSGKEHAWKLKDIPEAINAAKSSSLAILGGQLQYIFDDATCELYWISADPVDKSENEDWTDFVYRSCTEFMLLFDKIVREQKFKKDALEWDLIRDKNDKGIDIGEHEYFVIYPISEDEYSKF